MSQIKRAVTFYSFQDNYVRKKMSLDDIMSYVKNELQADMEFIPDQMLKGAPYSTEETLKEWDRLVAKNGIRPVCCGSYINDKLYKNRMLTIKEGTQKLIDEIKLAHRLGFPMIKLVSTTRPEIVERALPTAEKYNVVLTEEIHGGMSFNMPYVQESLKMMDRLKSPYLGFTIDTGIFCRRHPRVSTNYFKTIGLNNEYIISYIDDIFARGTDPNAYFMAHPEAQKELMDKCSNETEALYIIYATGYDNNPLQILDDYLGYVKHIHGKVYEMTEEGVEYSIPYDEVVNYLKEKNFDGYISTEYEGTRFTVFGEIPPEVDQVTKHQQLLKRLIEC